MNKLFNGLMVAALAACVLAAVFAFSNAFGGERKYDEAPVYLPAGDGVLKQIATLRYEYTPGYEIKACFTDKPNPRVVRCLIHSYEDGAAFFMDVESSEGGT